jgi:hypothetical protein
MASPAGSLFPDGGLNILILESRLQKFGGQAGFQAFFNLNRRGEKASGEAPPGQRAEGGQDDQSSQVLRGWFSFFGTAPFIGRSGIL